MILLLCSRNDTVRNKWFSALAPGYKMHQAASFGELTSMLKRFHLDILLVHRSMVDIEQLREICSMAGGTKIFVLADRPNDREGIACLQLGCVGYSNTYTAPARLKTAVETVGGGRVWVGTSLMKRLIKGLSSGKGQREAELAKTDVSPAIANLSKREYQIAMLVAEGNHNSEIAAELGITERTVKAHLSAVYVKTHTKGRLNLALLINKGE